MLATAADLQNIPGMSLTAARPLPWLNMLLIAANAAVLEYIKRDIELSSYVDLMDGANQPDLIIRQRPVWLSQTNLAAPSIGAALPQATITVASTAGFHPGTFGNPNVTPPTAGVCVGSTSNIQVSSFTYTGVTATTFTGCSGGSGTMQNFPNSTAPCSVYSPVVWYDPQASRGQGPNAFGTGTQMILGQQYMVIDDARGKGSLTPLPAGVRASNRGLIRRWGGGGFPMGGWWGPGNYMGDKLAGTREPGWNQGRGCIKVAYSAGFLTPPPTLQYAVLMTVAQMVRIMPNGTDMGSEGLGNYTYSALVNGDNPEMGSIRRILARWRESSWSSGN